MLHQKGQSIRTKRGKKWFSEQLGPRLGEKCVYAYLNAEYLILSCLTNLALLAIISSMKKQNQTLGECLRIAREEKQFSLRAVEKTTGISNAYLSQLESGKIQRPSPVNLHKLSELYQLSYAEVLGLAGYPVPFEAEAESSHSALKARLGHVTHEEEDALVEYLEFMRSRKKRIGRS